MKVSMKTVRVGILKALTDIYDMRDIAEKMTETIGEHVPGLELNGVRSHSFTIRCAGEIPDNDIMTESMIDAIREMLDEELDDVVDYIADNYDFAYEAKYVDAELVAAFFDWSVDGRIMTVEIDV